MGDRLPISRKATNCAGYVLTSARHIPMISGRLGSLRGIRPGQPRFPQGGLHFGDLRRPYADATGLPRPLSRGRLRQGTVLPVPFPGAVGELRGCLDISLWSGARQPAKGVGAGLSAYYWGAIHGAGAGGKRGEPLARSFYERRGFVLVGRLELDILGGAVPGPVLYLAMSGRYGPGCPVPSPFY
jgi:hypothetical protein